MKAIWHAGGNKDILLTGVANNGGVPFF